MSTQQQQAPASPIPGMARAAIDQAAALGLGFTSNGRADTCTVFEAVECSANSLELLLRTLRNGVMPYQQQLLDTNPGPFTHHLNQSCNAGTITRILSRHEDNPLLWDVDANGWTEFGRRYIGHGILMRQPVFGQLERAGHAQDRHALLCRNHPARRKALAVKIAHDAVDDRMIFVSGSHEIGVERMRLFGIIG